MLFRAVWLLSIHSASVITAADVPGHDKLGSTWRGWLPNPSSYESPRFRYWWSGGWIDPDDVKSELEAVSLAGFGGVEIGDVRDSITTAMDPTTYGWGQERWNEGVLAAYKQAKEMDLYVDSTLGPHWPTGVPGYTPDSLETAKELVHGHLLLSPGESYHGVLPLPAAEPSGQTTGNPNITATPGLIAILATRTSTLNATAPVIMIEHSTVTDITKHYRNATLSWTAPRDGRYVVVAIYSRGTGQVQNMYDMNPNGPKLTDPAPAYVVDHLSVTGVEASIKYWNEHILTDELRALMKTSGASLFEDSLELKSTQYWTRNFLEEFERRRGYELTPYLLYVLKDTNTFAGDLDIARMVEYDFYSTVSDLYIDYRLTTLKRFAHSLGLKLRVQPYTASFNSSRAAAFIDIPEGESLTFADTPNSFRVLAAGRDVAGKTTILSNEIGAVLGKAYGVTWDFLLGTANYNAALGASQSVIHGFPYQDSPDSRWPGFSAFTLLGSLSNGFADAWGPRQPQWMFAKDASGYLARSQAILQSGSPSVDVAILNLDWGVTASWHDMGLNDAGYSYQFPTPELLAEYSASVQNRRLAYDGPRYKALVINNATSINIKTAEMVLSFAEAGLPIVLVGDTPSSTQSLSEFSEQTKSALGRIFKSLLSLKNTVQVSTQTQVPSSLRSLGVKPLIQYSNATNTTFITTRRRIEDGEHIYWIYSSAQTSQPVSLEGEGYPLKINLWTGEASPIASFRTVNGYTILNVTVGENGAVAIYFGQNNPYNITNLKQHITATDAESIVDASGRVYARASKNGTYSVELSTGQAKAVTFNSVPPPITLQPWTLTVEDWSPVNINQTGLNASATTRTILDPIELHELQPWHNISVLEFASGVGVYQTTVNISTSLPHFPRSERQNIGIYLDFGTVGGSWALEINSHTVPGVDFFTAKPLDITPYIREGQNDIAITLATTLWNKLRKTLPELYAALEPQDIGLLGPVRVVYYAQERVL
ncbi:hypothetical protein BJY04DRAFT_232294 [Aspergillus karnatakaensis]|uniref:uncharacterized protein n=1 Tax=Aspergillus karnatakaensis TaxID=1810916 RepID=UPI003CCD83B9